MVDCGGNMAQSAGVIASNHLKGRGKMYIDILILTHLHDDHMNGVISLLELVDVGEILFFDASSGGDGNRMKLLNAADRLNIRCLNVDRDMSISFGNGYVDFHAPSGSNRNDNEICLSVLFGYKDFKALITGDLGELSELDLIMGRRIPDVDVYVAGHHGSANSSTITLLNKIKPEKVIISVGKNTYGHPSEEALERFRLINAEILRTDLLGSIEIRVS